MHLRTGAPERRARRRGTAEGEPARAQLVTMIVGTFREMPALSLKLDQAARLFGLRPATCKVILEDLVAANSLRRGADGQYRSGELHTPLAGSATAAQPHAAQHQERIVRRGR